MAREHQQSRNAAAQLTDLYLQKKVKTSFNFQARAVASLLATRTFSF